MLSNLWACSNGRSSDRCHKIQYLQLHHESASRVWTTTWIAKNSGNDKLFYSMKLSYCGTSFDKLTENSSFCIHKLIVGWISSCYCFDISNVSRRFQILLFFCALCLEKLVEAFKVFFFLDKTSVGLQTVPTLILAWGTSTFDGEPSELFIREEQCRSSQNPNPLWPTATSQERLSV